MRIAIVVLEMRELPAEWQKEDVAREIALAFPKAHIAGAKIFNATDD